MHILAIETSCDETAIALVQASGGLRQPRFKVLKNLVASQIETHRPYGGVVPMLAKREHLKNLPILLKELETRKQELGKTDVIAVTVGPGLEPCLWAGVGFAKNLAREFKASISGVNHLEGHIYSSWLNRNQKLGIAFPAIVLLVSGGHTILLYMISLTQWKKLGETRDDAAGEAFDKVARLLGLPYPGGPELEKLAKKGDAKAIDFPRPMLNQKNFDFSFSGLKTSALYYLRDNPKANKADVAASVQSAIIEVLVKKTVRAAAKYSAKSILLCGGVAANRALRNNLQLTTNNLRLKFFVPDFEYNTDNAAMIAAAAYIQHLQKKNRRIIAQPNLNL